MYPANRSPEPRTITCSPLNIRQLPKHRAISSSARNFFYPNGLIYNQKQVINVGLTTTPSITTIKLLLLIVIVIIIIINTNTSTFLFNLPIFGRWRQVSRHPSNVTQRKFWGDCWWEIFLQAGCHFLSPTKQCQNNNYKDKCILM